MALDRFMDGLHSGLSNTMRMVGAVRSLRAQKKQEAYQEGLQRAVASGDLMGGRDLALGMGDAATAREFEATYMRDMDRKFDQLARENPDFAATVDPSRWAKWKAHEDARQLNMDQGLAALTATQQGTDIQSDLHDWRKEDRATAKDTEKINNAARGFLSLIDNNPENVADGIPYLSRLAEQNPQLFQKAFALDTHRIPRGFEMVDTPDGPRITMRVFNEQTQSEGPVTEGQSAAGADTVISLDPAAFVRMIRQHTGVKPTKPEKGRFGIEEVGGKLVLLDSATGKTVDMGTAPDDDDQDWVRGEAKALMGTGMFADMNDMDKSINNALMTIGGTVARMDGMGEVDGRQAMRRAHALLTGDGELAAEYQGARTFRERNAVLVRVMQESGVPIDVAAEGGATEAAGPEDGLDAVAGPQAAPEATREPPGDSYADEYVEVPNQGNPAAQEAMRQGSTILPGLIAPIEGQPADTGGLGAVTAPTGTPDPAPGPGGIPRPSGAPEGEFEQAPMSRAPGRPPNQEAGLEMLAGAAPGSPDMPGPPLSVEEATKEMASLREFAANRGDSDEVREVLQRAQKAYDLYRKNAGREAYSRFRDTLGRIYERLKNIGLDALDRPEDVSETGSFDEAFAKRTGRLEGWRSRAYADSRGIRTIGFGTNIDGPEFSREERAIIGDNPTSITREQGDRLFSLSRRRVTAEMDKDFPKWKSWPRAAQLAIADMSYNMGGPRFDGFEEMKKALLAGDFKTAAKELLDSDYARSRDTGPRAKRNARLLEQAAQQSGTPVASR